MSGDIKLIRLCRRTKYNKASDSEETDRNKFLATDYFDILKYENISMNEDMTRIMGIGPDNFHESNDVSVQSYPIYCSEDMLYKGHKNRCYGDPFYDKEKMPFLSLIQVHITPEIFAYLDIENGKEIIEIFEDDLYAVLDAFVSKHDQCEMVYRIYRLLSTGDFSVVVRSKDVSTPFNILTSIRKCSVAYGEGNTKRLVLYKTYTLLTMNSQLLLLENANEPKNQNFGDKNKFVIRCCYSNKYWAEWKNVEKFRKEHCKDIMPYIANLSGRYDFSVDLEEDDFRQIFPFIWRFKNGQGYEMETNNFDPAKITGQVSIVVYLKYLIKSEYLSYINERYLLRNADEGKDVKINSIIDSHIKTETNGWLSARNGDRYGSIKDVYYSIEQRLNELDRYRKNLIYYFALLGRLIELCQSTNSISDTRIHTGTLLKQAETVLQSLDYYLDIFEKTHDSVLVDLMEQYLRESVCALDAYARYIRNNNMQSLQTPNYNVESTTSMEKIMIGYSEFVRLFNEYYLNSQVSKDIGLYYGEKKQYLPVVVSTLSREELSVEVAYPEGQSMDWVAEKEVQKKYSEHIYLLIITCPTLKELGCLPNMLTLLYHEIAHQFRYKKRKERNALILKYSLMEAFEIIAEEIVIKFKIEEGLRDTRESLTKLFRDCLCEVYISLMYCSGKGLENDWIDNELADYLDDEYDDVPLSSFQDRLAADFQGFMNGWREESKYSTFMEDFMQSMSRYLNFSDKDIKGFIVKFCSSMQELQNNFEVTDKEARKQKMADLNEMAMEIAFMAASEAACVEKVLMPGDLEKMPLDERKKTLKKYFQDSNKECALIYDVLRAFIYRFKELFSKGFNLKYRGLKKKYLDEVYSAICREWQMRSHLSDYAVSNPEAKAWEAIGRYYGIDYKSKENIEIFKKCIELDLTDATADATEHLISCIGFYREEASDLFMKTFIPLTPFGYVNLMAANLPLDQEIKQEYARRIIRVMVAGWSETSKDGELKKSRKEDTYQFYSQCKAIYKTLLQFGTSLFQKYGYEGLWENISSIVRNSGWEYRQVKREDVDSLEKCCRTVLKETIDAENSDESVLKFLSEVKYFYSICKVLSGILKHSDDEIKKLYDRKYLLDDYRDGIKKLKELAPLDKNLNKIMVELFELNNLIADSFNRPQEFCMDSSKGEKLNEKSLSFLMDAYYNSKCREAKSEIRGDKIGR